MKRRSQLQRKHPISPARRRGLSPRSLSHREVTERQDVLAAVFARDGFRCQAAGLDFGECFGSLTPHHLLKASQGGRYTVDNLLTLCSAHNDRVEDYPLRARQLGLVRKSRERKEQTDGN